LRIEAEQQTLAQNNRFFFCRFMLIGGKPKYL